MPVCGGEPSGPRTAGSFLDPQELEPGECGWGAPSGRLVRHRSGRRCRLVDGARRAGAQCGDEDGVGKRTRVAHLVGVADMPVRAAVFVGPRALLCGSRRYRLVRRMRVDTARP